METKPTSSKNYPQLLFPLSSLLSHQVAQPEYSHIQIRKRYKIKVRAEILRAHPRQEQKYDFSEFDVLLNEIARWITEAKQKTKDLTSKDFIKHLRKFQRFLKLSSDKLSGHCFQNLSVIKFFQEFQPGFQNLALNIEVSECILLLLDSGQVLHNFIKSKAVLKAYLQTLEMENSRLISNVGINYEQTFQIFNFLCQSNHYFLHFMIQQNIYHKIAKLDKKLIQAGTVSSISRFLSNLMFHQRCCQKEIVSNVLEIAQQFLTHVFSLPSFFQVSMLLYSTLFINHSQYEYIYFSVAMKKLRKIYHQNRDSSDFNISISRLVSKFLSKATSEQNQAIVNDIFDQGFSYDFIQDIENCSLAEGECQDLGLLLSHFQTLLQFSVICENHAEDLVDSEELLPSIKSILQLKSNTQGVIELKLVVLELVRNLFQLGNNINHRVYVKSGLLNQVYEFLDCEEQNETIVELSLDILDLYLSSNHSQSIMHERVLMAQGTGCVRLINKVKESNYSSRVVQMCKFILASYFSESRRREGVRIEL